MGLSALQKILFERMNAGIVIFSLVLGDRMGVDF